MARRRLIVIVACTLLPLQAATIAALHGKRAAALISDLVQIGLGMTCLCASLQARSRSGRASCYHWTWLSVSFVGFILAQTLGTYIDVSSDHSCDRLDDILFSLSVIPMAMLPFVDPDREQSRFDRLHVLDFVQVSCFWAAVYLYFRDTTGLALATVGWEGFGWSSALVFHAILTLSFVLGAVLGRSRAALSFFGGMAVYVFVAGLADSYAALPANNVQSGQWFDLLWSSLQLIPLFVALTWNQDASLVPLPARTERMVLSHLLPLVYPFFAVLLLVRDAPRNASLSSVMAMVVFVALGVRILIAQHRLLRAQDTLEYEASHDALTGTCNRASILETLSREFLRHQRTHETLTVMLADIDHFKTVNDTYGHIVGDQVLAEVARRLTASMRGCDAVGRYGGEEFLIILPNCSASGAITAGERLRSCIAEVPVSTTGGPISVSISIGSASTFYASSSPGQTLLLRMADDALYQAKAKGRNRVEQAMVACDTSSANGVEMSCAKAGSA
ncbi:MAG TPA: GGDEF domain-containing protein [Candidatus Binatia bacterium]|nr:GGDEF domain-containing protein [Candidatus Binatia bacterium]